MPTNDTSITSGQVRKLGNFAYDAVAKVVEELGLDKEGAQCVIEVNGDEFCESMRAAARAALKKLSISNQYADEEVESNYGYLSGYKPKGLVEQTNRLRELFSGIGYANQDLLTQIEKGEVKLPKNAEGWFAIPNWKKNPGMFGKTYAEALQKILDKFKEARGGKFKNWREGEIDDKHVRQSARTEKYFVDLSEAQGNPDILIVPAQFGIRHRGKSVRRVRVVIAKTNEFALGAFAIVSMLLTHPERLAHYNDLWIDCAGDEFAPAAVGAFCKAFCLGFHGDGVHFDADGVGSVGQSSGSPSGFLPQQQ